MGIGFPVYFWGELAKSVDFIGNFFKIGPAIIKMR